MMLTTLAAVVLAVPTVSVVQTPNRGIQPQAAMDARGTLHLLYFVGRVDAGNLEYIQSKDGGDSWTNPIRVNSTDNSAVAVGTIRGGQISVSPGGNVHIVWLGNTKNAGLFYSQKRSSDESFTNQVDLADGTQNLDGGASVTSDDASVYVVWHANAKKGESEEQRHLWLRTSRDIGKTFVKKTPLTTDQGACACCATKAALDQRGRLLAMYRSAQQGLNRDTFSVEWSWSYKVDMLRLDPWESKQCPMSTFAILPGTPVFRAWETKGRIYMNGKALPGESAKHPSLAKMDGTILCAYVIGSGWAKGGKLSWSLMDTDGKVLESKDTEEEVPVWSLASAVAVPKKGYLIFR